MNMDGERTSASPRGRATRSSTRRAMPGIDPLVRDDRWTTGRNPNRGRLSVNCP